MGGRVHGGRERQLAFLDRRLRELEGQSAAAASELIAATSHERRTPRRAELEQEVERLRRERTRLAVEQSIADSADSDDHFERHLASIERQIREAFEERDRWFRHSLDGQRRRQEDFRQLQRLKEENERLTAELLRCASALCRSREAAEHPRMRRVWQMLRLSGT